MLNLNKTDKRQASLQNRSVSNTPSATCENNGKNSKGNENNTRGRINSRILDMEAVSTDLRVLEKRGGGGSKRHLTFGALEKKGGVIVEIGLDFLNRIPAEHRGLGADGEGGAKAKYCKNLTLARTQWLEGFE